MPVQADISFVGDSDGLLGVGDGRINTLVDDTIRPDTLVTVQGRLN